MKKNILSLSCIMLCVLLSSTARANHSAFIKDAWIADAPPIAKIRAAYLVLSNPGKHDIKISTFSSPDFKRIELHKTEVANGMVKMDEVKQLTVKPGQSIEFKPGGYHLMLFNPKRKLKNGDSVTIKLTLQDNMTSSFTAIVRKRGDDMGKGHQQHHKCGSKCGGK